MKQMPRLAVAVWLVFGVMWSLRADGTEVVSANINDLMGADVIFVGRCVGAKTHQIQSKDSPGNLPVTTYTFTVSKVIKDAKGSIPDPSKGFQFTQLGTSREAAKQFGGLSIADMPSYQDGREYTLFLGSETGLGLRAPMYLEQGKFTISPGKGGRKLVTNGRGNKDIFRNLPATKSMSKALSAGRVSPGSAQTGGAMDYDSFVKMIEELKKGE